MVQLLKHTAIEPDLIYPESDGKSLADHLNFA